MNRYALYARKSQEDEGRQQQSIEDQTRLLAEMAQRLDLNVVQTLHEEKSAKEPYQRPIFDKLIAQVQNGEIDSLLCYHVNRLARNMVEGGLLQHLLTKGQLKEIRTHTEVFKSGDNILPFILQAAMSTQYSLDLSNIVRRGLTSKIEKGGYPQRAPEGYVNNLFEHTIEADPDRFPLIRKAWELMLTGSYSVERLANMMNEQWGYKTRKARKIGGTPLGKSTLHRLFGNLFYTGHFLHKGELRQGTHPAMITFEEYEAVQKILKRNGPTRPKAREFAFTGLLVCGRCGRQVTAEHKRGHTGRGDYTYYHCANYNKCGERSIRQEELEARIDAHLQSVAISPQYRALVLDVIERAYAEESAKDQAQYAQHHRALEEAQKRQSRLIQMAMRELLTDAEFAAEKQAVQEEINTLKRTGVQAETQLQRAREGALEVAKFVSSAPYEFAQGTPQHKREIARKLGVVYRLRDGNLEMELHPLLVPLASRPIEPLKSGSESKKDGSLEPSVSLGWGEGTMLEPFHCIWNLLLSGAPHLSR